MVNAGEKYSDECSVDPSSASRVSLDNEAGVVCVGYYRYQPSLCRAEGSSLTFRGWKNLVCDSRCASDEKPLPQSYSWQ